MTIERVGDSPIQFSGLAAPGVPLRPRVFVLSNVLFLREGVVAALSQQPSIQVMGSSDLSVPPRQIAELLPDVLLLDVTIPGSLDVSRPIREAMPDVKIVALGVADVEQVVMDCAKAGVSGFVAPSGSANDVVGAVLSAVRGELVCSPRTAGMLLGHVGTLSARLHDRSDDSALTQREKEVARLIGDGLSNKQIARALGIQEPTVKNHVHSILGKLKMHRRIEIAAQSHRGPTNGAKSSARPTIRPNGRRVYPQLGRGSDQAN